MLRLRRALPVSATLLPLLLAACSDSSDAPPAPAPAPTAAPTPPAEKAPDPPPAAPLCSDDDVVGSISKIQGVGSVTEVSCGQYVPKPARCFSLKFKQAIDHGPKSDGVTFEQQMQLVHRGCDAPTTIMDNGYNLPKYYYEMEPSMMFDTNTVIVEHRFQGRSLPDTKDRRWSSLSVENGAADVHDIVTAFKKLYPKRWVSTGASKGGITAVYHRFLYPNDVDGTVAYVAPASRARQDPRYQERLGSGVLPAACAADVRAFQTGALGARRPAFVAFLRDTYGATDAEASYYLESYLSSFDWGFWQAGGDCAKVPSPAADDKTHVAYFESVLSSQGGAPHVAPAPSSSELSSAALSYEWAWQQGFALQVGAHVTPLLQTTAVADARHDAFWASVVPKEPLPAFDGSVTERAREWVRSSAERLVLVYGELDPWSGGALDAPTHPSSGRYFVTGADHGANIGGLGKTDRERATSAVAAMYGTPMKVQTSSLTSMVRASHEAVQRHELAALAKARALRLPVAE